MGLMDAVLRTVERIRQEQQLGPVRMITIEVGELSGVVPRFLEECYEAVAAGTPFEKTALAIEMVPGLARCEDCRKEFRPANTMLRSCLQRRKTHTHRRQRHDHKGDRGL